MKLIDLQKQIATITSAATITLGAAVGKFRTVAQAITAGVIAVGDSGVAFYVFDPATGAFESGYYTITSATVITRERIVRSSNNNAAVSFGGAACEVYSALPTDYLEGVDIASLPTVTTVPTGAFALLLGTDGSLSKILASTLAGSGSGGTAATAPGAPTIGTATAGNASASVAFTAPSSNGGAAITGYTITAYKVSDNSQVTSATGTASPISVTGLTNGTAVYFKASATNSAGTGAQSAASNSVTPAAPVQGLYQVRTTNASGQKINGVNYFPPAGSTATMAKAANGVDYFTNNNDIFVSVLKADGTTMAPSPTKFVWLKSSTQCPLTYADSALPVGINGNTEAYADAFRTVNLMYGNTFNAGSVYARGAPGTYYLWAVTSDGFVGVYDNGTGTPVGWTLSA